jgi:hypothetical protein
MLFFYVHYKGNLLINLIFATRSILQIFSFFMLIIKETYKLILNKYKNIIMYIPLNGILVPNYITYIDGNYPNC